MFCTCVNFIKDFNLFSSLHVIVFIRNMQIVERNPQHQLSLHQWKRKKPKTIRSYEQSHWNPNLKRNVVKVIKILNERNNHKLSNHKYLIVPQFLSQTFKDEERKIIRSVWLAPIGVNICTKLIMLLSSAQYFGGNYPVVSYVYIHVPIPWAHMHCISYYDKNLSLVLFLFNTNCKINPFLNHYTNDKYCMNTWLIVTCVIHNPFRVQTWFSSWLKRCTFHTWNLRDLISISSIETVFHLCI